MLRQTCCDIAVIGAPSQDWNGTNTVSPDRQKDLFFADVLRSFQTCVFVLCNGAPFVATFSTPTSPVFLSNSHHQPLHRCPWNLSDVFGQPVSSDGPDFCSLLGVWPKVVRRKRTCCLLPWIASYMAKLLKFRTTDRQFRMIKPFLLQTYFLLKEGVGTKECLSFPLCLCQSPKS